MHPEGGNVFSNPVPPAQNKIGSPGLPWGFEARIVDRDGVECRQANRAKYFCAGDGMMQGYYKDPEAPQRSWTDGWLHTGDLAYRDEDGYFFVVGRSKELIIKGGMNIAPEADRRSAGSRIRRCWRRRRSAFLTDMLARTVVAFVGTAEQNDVRRAGTAQFLRKPAGSF